MDMWDPYVASVRAICRKRMARSFSTSFMWPSIWVMLWTRYGGRKTNSESRRGRPFGGHRYDWLRNPTSMERRPQGVRRTGNSELKTARAWALERDGHDSIQLRLRTSGEEHFRWWHNWAVRSRLQPMIGVARMLKRRFENIITYCDIGSRMRPANPSMPRSMGEVHGAGFRNRQNFVHAIYFHCAASTWPGIH